MSKRRYTPTSPVALLAGSWGKEFDIVEVKSVPFALVAGGAVAIVDVCGPLVQRAGGLFDSYEAIESRVCAALDSSASTVVLRIDSPGGDALGVFETARELRALAVAKRKPLIAYCDGALASAAYALACCATAIYAPAAGLVGSIGVIQPMVDQTAQDRMSGLNVAMVSSGARKLDGNPHVALSEAAIAEAQARVDGLAWLFFGLVEEMRGVPAADVQALQGGVYLGAQAREARLIDDVMSWNDLIAMVAKRSGTSAAGSVNAEKHSMDPEKKASAIAAIRAAFGDDKDGAEKAIAAAFPEPEAEPKKEEKAEAEAEPPPPPPKKDEKDDGAKAQIFALAAKVQTMEAERAAEKRDIELQALFAKRPDFDETIRASLADMPIERVREAVEKWPRIGAVKLAPPGALAATGTRGATQVDEAVSTLPQVEIDAMDRKMGLKAEGTGIRRTGNGRAVELGMMTADQAQAFLTAHAAQTKGAA